MEAIVAALDEGRGIIHHSTGSGKTETMAAIIQMLDLPAIVMVNQATIVNQTRKRLFERLNRPIGIITGTKKVNSDIVCATFQSLNSQLKNDQKNQTHHLRKFLSKFQVLCIDEAHHALAKTYQQVINACPAFYRFGFCIAQGTPILLANGLTKPIEQLKKGDKIISWDKQQPVINFVQSVWASGVQDCLTIRLLDGEELRCTPDHLIYLVAGNQSSNYRRNWVEAKNLKPHQVIWQIIPYIPLVNTNNTRAIALGTLAGDSCISKTGNFVFTHNGIQADYARWKAQQLGFHFSQTIRHNQIIGQGNKCNKFFKEMRKFFYPNGRKSLPRIIESFQGDWLALAIWILDDGSWSGPKTRRLDISLGNITLLEQQEIITILNRDFGLEVSVASDKAKYRRLYLPAKSTAKVLKHISKLVPLCMSYKLGVQNNFIQIRGEIESVNHSIALPTWDISVNRTHNFVANNIVVHNSATPEKTANKGARLHLIGSTGPVIDKFTAGEGVEKGLLVKAHITFLKWHEDNPEPSWTKEDFEINDKLYRYTGRKYETIEINGKNVKRKLNKPQLGLYDVGIVRHPVRNSFIIDSVACMYEEGLTILVLVERIDHGLYLKKAIEQDLNTPVIFLQGSNDQNSREIARKKFSSGENRILIATTIFDEGVDIPAIDGLILTAGGKAQHRVVQRLGRGMRPKEDKTILKVIDFMDTHSKILWKHANERLKAYKSDSKAYQIEIEEIQL